MKNNPVILTILIFLFLPVLITTSQCVQDLSPIEKELWQLEQTYMQNYKDRNLAVLTDFWHKEFVGWPQWATVPVNVDTAKSVLQQPSETKITDFKIRPQNINLHGEMAITYYLIDVYLKNQKNEQSTTTYRVIHTWIKENGNWQILGGMSAS